MTRPVVIGAGSWGTALSLVLARRGFPVRLWVHNPVLAEEMSRSRENSAYLPGFPLCKEIEICTNLHNALAGADAVLLAVPSYAMRAILSQAPTDVFKQATLISTTKGLEEETLLRMSQVIDEVSGVKYSVVLSGPSFAREVAAEQPTALLAASADLARAQTVQLLMSGGRFRVYLSSDVIGAELGGAIKNVIAIAAGVCHGLNLGSNAVAALITRGLAEMSRLAIALGAQPQTLAGLAGLGDLVVTCTGELSRNRQVGIQLARGETIEQISTRMRMIAEGIKSTDSVVELGRRRQVDLPISEQMHAVLHGRRSPVDAIRILMERSPRFEY